MTTTILVPTMGVVLISAFICSTLYGATSMQTYSYFQRFWHTDRWNLKVLITFIWILETIQVFLLCASIFKWLILDIDDPTTLLKSQLTLDLTIGNTSLIVLAVHCFYAQRLWILSKKNVLLVSVVLILAACNFAFEMVVMSSTIMFPEFAKFERNKPFFTSALAFAAADDILIACSMFYLLIGRKTGVKSTNTLVARIITYTITTGMLTSFLDVIILISYVTMEKKNLVYLGFYNFIANLYANSLLGMLNARESLREIRRGPSSFQLTDLHSSKSAVESSSHHTQPVHNITKGPWTTVEVTTDTVTM